METKVEEIWKVITKVPNYSVSNLGRIRNNTTGHILKPQSDHKGYQRVRILHICTLKVHREVAKAFIDNPNNKPQVNHKDTNKKNNLFTNLEWVTNKQNSEHAQQNGLIVGFVGSSHPRAILTESDVVKIRSMKHLTKRQLAEMYGMTIGGIKAVVTGKNWKHIK